MTAAAALPLRTRSLRSSAAATCHCLSETSPNSPTSPHSLSHMCVSLILLCAQACALALGAARTLTSSAIISVSLSPLSPSMHLSPAPPPPPPFPLFCFTRQTLTTLKSSMIPSALPACLPASKPGQGQSTRRTRLSHSLHARSATQLAAASDSLR